MISDLMLAITGTPGDENALLAATALAEHTGAHLSVVEALNLPMPSPPPWGIVPGPMLDDLHAELRAEAKARAATLRQRLERSSCPHDVRVLEAFDDAPLDVLARQARYSDLTLMTAARPPFDPSHDAIEAVFASLLFGSGRPVLVVPPNHPMELPIGHAVVAWQPTREATRALHDALPLLEQASSIDIVMVGAESGGVGSSHLPGSDIAAHLARRGLKANVVVQPPGRETVATVLLRHAADTNARLLVAGGYGHSRLREWFLGGTTRELLQAICLPILFSH